MMPNATSSLARPRFQSFCSKSLLSDPRSHESSSFKQFSMCSKEGCSESDAGNWGGNKASPEMYAFTRGGMRPSSARRVPMIREMEWVSTNSDDKVVRDWETRSRVEICFVEMGRGMPVVILGRT